MAIILKIKEVIKKGSWLLPYSTYICNTAGFHYQVIPMGNSVMSFSKCSWSPDLTNKYISSLNLSLEANMNDLFRWVDIENFNLCSAPAFQMKAQCMSLKHWEKKNPFLSLPHYQMDVLYLFTKLKCCTLCAWSFSIII